MSDYSAVTNNIKIKVLFFPDAIHFTQMIWRSTADVGVGVSKINDQEKYVVVVHYRPPGNSNMPGDFKKNVPQPL